VGIEFIRARLFRPLEAGPDGDTASHHHLFGVGGIGELDIHQFVVTRLVPVGETVRLEVQWDVVDLGNRSNRRKMPSNLRSRLKSFDGPQLDTVDCGPQGHCMLESGGEVPLALTPEGVVYAPWGIHLVLTPTT
jgi:hypothetical protein